MELKTRAIPLSQGQTAIIDEQDYEAVSKHKWCACWNPNGKRFYVTSSIEGRTIYLHRFLIDPSPGLTVDHVNMNALDNRRANLRLATKSQNQMNRRIQRNNTSGFKGVHLFKRTGKFRAYIMVQGKEKHLGYFATAEEAHVAYVKAAVEIHGEFAQLC